MLGDNPILYVLVCWHDYFYYNYGVFMFKLVFVPSKAFGMTQKMSRIDTVQKQKFNVQWGISLILLKRLFDLKFLHSIYIQIIQVVLIVQNFWSYRIMVFVQIITDCSVLDRLCFCLHSLLVLMMLDYIGGYKSRVSYNL